MDTLLGAVLGVLVGAIASGGVQSYFARRDREREGRSSARLLFMELQEAAKAMKSLQSFKRWNAVIVDWSQYGVMWERHCENLSRMLEGETDNFMRVSEAFSSISILARMRRADEAEPRPDGAPALYSLGDQFLVEYIRSVETARDIVRVISFSPGEIQRVLNNRGATPLVVGVGSNGLPEAEAERAPVAEATADIAPPTP